MNYRPDRLPCVPADKVLKEAFAVIGSAHELEMSEWTELSTQAERTKARVKLGKLIREREQVALYRWATKHNHLLPASSFTNLWKEAGSRGGAEHEVYFDEEMQGWWKRNDLSYHDTYLSFFQRIALHQYLFPEAPFELRGFMVDFNRSAPERILMLKPVTFQRHVRSDCGADESQVTDVMRSLNAHKVGIHDYSFADLHIRVEDLHDENALLAEDAVIVIDPVLYLEETGKADRLRNALRCEGLALSKPHVLRNERAISIIKNQSWVNVTDAYAQYDLIQGGTSSRHRKQRIHPA